MKIRIGQFFVSVPAPLAEFLVVQESARWARIFAALSPMDADVRQLAVQHLPAANGPLSAAALAELAGLTLEEVRGALVRLHRLLGFLAIDDDGAVTWAYPVSADQTPHRLTFETGERMTAACAADSMATPFVQGRLLNRHLSAILNTTCAQSGQALEIEIDSDFQFELRTREASPVISVPLVNFHKPGFDVIYKVL